MKPMTFVLLPVLLILTSCDQSARDFAKSARAILNEYAAQINKQIQTESVYYQRYAVLEVKHQHENLLIADDADRGERRINVAADLQESSKPATRVRSDLAEYAQALFNTRRDSYYQDADATRQYLAKLQVLQADQERISALGKLLDSLSTKPSLSSNLSVIKQAVIDTKNDFDTDICNGIATKLAAATAQADKDSLTKLQQDRKCPTTSGGN